VVGRMLEMLGSREVSVNEIRPRVPWAPSHSFHVMPPRITRNSHRPRASDRTMVDLESPFACRSRKTRRRRLLTRGDSSQWAQVPLLQRSLILVGWISRKPLASGRGRTFFLTSLLIELTDTDFGEQKAQSGENA